MDNFNALQDTADMANESGESETKHDMELEKNPLLIGSILEIIFGFLDGNSIKEARQVNKLWNIEGAKVLFTKSFLRIPLSLWHPASVTKKETTEKFKAFLSYKSSEKSMIPNITINNVEDVELWKSLGVLGQQIISLKWNIGDDQVYLFQNLLDLIPNLKYLSLNDELFHCGAKKIIKVLASIMSEPEKEGNPLVISCMELQAHTVEELQDMEKFSDCKNIKLECLLVSINPKFFREVPVFGARMANMVNKVLSTNQNTLKKIKLYFCGVYLYTLDFPCMPSLTHMDLDFSETNRLFLDCCEFPPSFRFSENVPNLRDIAINNGKNKEGSDFFDLFDNAGTALSVKRLKYSEEVDEYVIDRIFQVFPNLEDLELKSPDCSKKIFRLLWEYGTNLKKLNITINLDQFGKGVPDFDALFTGFPKWTVKMLQKRPHWTPYTVGELETLRAKPSILKLQELEELKIIIRKSRQKNEIPKRMLAITGEYALKRLPRLVQIVIVDRTYPHSKGVFAEVSKLPNVLIKEEEDYEIEQEGDYDDESEDSDDYDDDDSEGGLIFLDEEEDEEEDEGDDDDDEEEDDDDDDEDDD